MNLTCGETTDFWITMFSLAVHSLQFAARRLQSSTGHQKYSR